MSIWGWSKSYDSSLTEFSRADPTIKEVLLGTNLIQSICLKYFRYIDNLLLCVGVNQLLFVEFDYFENVLLDESHYGYLALTIETNLWDLRASLVGLHDGEGLQVEQYYKTVGEVTQRHRHNI